MIMPSRLLVSALALTAVLVTSRPATAQPNPKLAPINALNQEAIGAFESYSFTKARKRLQQALDLASESGLVNDPGIAQTHVLMGVAYIAGSNDLYRGLYYFVKGLRLDPKTTIPQKLATPQLLKMFNTADRAVKVVAVPPTIALGSERREQGSQSVQKASGRGLLHSPIDSVKRGYPIPVKAQVGVDIQAHRLFLHFRPTGTVKFTTVPMKKAKGVFRASIPASATRGRTLHYYIEAVDQRGRLAGSMGSARSPNVVTVN